MSLGVSRHPLTMVVGFEPRSVHVGFVVDEVTLGQVFFPSSLVFLPSVSFHWCTIHMSFIFNQCYIIFQLHQQNTSLPSCINSCVDNVFF
jgi:hypothetical protein